MTPRPLLTIERAAALCCSCAAIVTMSGCAMMMNMRPAADSYTYDLGMASPADTRARAEAALTPLGYKLSRDDGMRGVRIESQWQSRAPVDDQERAGGYEIISRVKLTGRSNSAPSAPNLYRVLLTVENRFVPSRGTSRASRHLGAPVGSTYARSIVKQVIVAFNGTSRPVADEPRPF
jgi:hypothetical protein